MQGESAPWDPWEHLHEHHPQVRVIATDLPGSLLGCVDHEEQIIWLARGLDVVRQRCTLAYELGQLYQGPTPNDPCLARAHQRAAEEWAATRLVSLRAMVEAFRVEAEIPAVAVLLNVDTATLRTRLRALTDDEQDRLMEAIRQNRESIF